MSEMMIKPEEITASLRKNLEGWEPSIAQETVGYVSSIADGVARVKGLPTAMASELLEFPGGLQGIALNVDEHDLGVVLMGESNHIEEGDPVKQTGKVLSVPVGDEMLGRVVDALGTPMDGKGQIFCQCPHFNGKNIFSNKCFSVTSDNSSAKHPSRIRLQYEFCHPLRYSHGSSSS